MATPLRIKTGRVLFLAQNTQSDYFKIDPGKLQHMVVILHVIKSECAIACIITSKLPQNPSLHYKYLLIQTELGFYGTTNSNLGTIHGNIISGNPFRKTSYIKIDQPFLVHRDDLEIPRHGQAELRYNEVINIRILVANAVPGYWTMIYQEASMFYFNSELDKRDCSRRLKPEIVNPASLKAASASKVTSMRIRAHYLTDSANTSREFDHESYPYTYDTYYHPTSRSKSLTTPSVDPYEYSRNSWVLSTGNQVRNSGQYSNTIGSGLSNSLGYRATKISTPGYQLASSSTNGYTYNRAQGYPMNIYGNRHTTLADIHGTSPHRTTQWAQDYAGISQEPLGNSKVVDGCFGSLSFSWYICVSTMVHVRMS